MPPRSTRTRFARRRNLRTCFSGRFARWRSMSSLAGSSAVLVAHAGSGAGRVWNDRLDPGRHGRVQHPHGRRGGAVRHHQRNRLPRRSFAHRERVAAREQFKQDHTQPVQIAAGVECGGGGAERRHVFRRAMYGSVPPIIARSAPPRSFVSSARLKSRSIGRPSSVSSTFAGFRSRCRSAARERVPGRRWMLPAQRENTAST